MSPRRTAGTLLSAAVDSAGHPARPVPPVDVAAVAERLMLELEGQVNLAAISRVVLGCIRDLTAVPDEALPELVERCARQRLTTSFDEPPPVSSAPPDPAAGLARARRQWA
jgi:hypothetical protein